MSAPTEDLPPPEIRPARDRAEVAEALAVRVAVFVDEQGGPPEDEPDAWDDAARHWVVRDGGRVVGTARLYHPGHAVAKIGRVALLPAYRRRGWGTRLLEEVLAAARGLGCTEAVLDAQAGAVSLYAALGFQAEGPEFQEAGIPHRRMRRTL